MKAYTDLEQSKKLAEILPIESADMWCNYYTVAIDDTTPQIIHIDEPWVGSFNWENKPDNIPCWSLAALLDVLDYEIVDEEGVSYFLNFYKEDNQYQLCYRYGLDTFGEDDIWTDSYDDFLDACYEMIIKLKEKDLL